MENIINELQELFMQMTSQQVYDKYIKPLNDNPDYSCPFKLNVKGNDEISDVWKNLWSI